MQKPFTHLSKKFAVHEISPDHQIQAHAEPILLSENFQRMENFIQHGTTSCRMHCYSVARCSLIIANRLRLRHDAASLVRGALLHDFFLYDWHEKQPDLRGLHGYTHPKAAYAKASSEFSLNSVERDIILRHMFPLTIIPPRSMEAWLVCLSDKICSIAEIFRHRTYSGTGTIQKSELFRHRNYSGIGTIQALVWFRHRKVSPSRKRIISDQPDRPLRSDAAPHP